MHVKPVGATDGARTLVILYIEGEDTGRLVSITWAYHTLSRCLDSNVGWLMEQL